MSACGCKIQSRTLILSAYCAIVTVGAFLYLNNIYLVQTGLHGSSVDSNDFPIPEEFVDSYNDNADLDGANSRALLLSPILNPDCNIVANDQEYEDRSKVDSDSIRELLSEDGVIRRTRDCPEYFRFVPVEHLRKRGEEGSDGKLGLAFSHQVHRDVGLLEIFLAVIFRPWNFHCIHVDEKSPSEVHESVEALARCYNQRFAKDGREIIHVIKDPISVYWGHISVLDADLMCLRELMSRSKDWDYFLNTAGTELPTAPYSEFVNMILKANGTNIMESYRLPKFFQSRINRYFTLQRFGPNKYDLKLVRTAFAKPPAPFGLTVYKGMKNVAITRDFSSFLLNHKVAKEFYKWLQEVRVPDEFFYQTMARINYIKPNLISQDHTRDLAAVGSPRYSQWVFERRSCRGKWIRCICNFALADLPHARTANALVLNKFLLSVDPRAAVCQWKFVRSLSDDPDLARNVTKFKRRSPGSNGTVGKS